MKRVFLSISLLLLSAAAVFAQKQINDANAETREAKNFTSISVSNAFDVYLTQGNEEAVAVSASEQKYKANIKVEVKDGVLKISYDEEGKFWKRLTGNMKLKAYISFKSVNKIIASGACDIHLQGKITAADLSINLSGASDWKNGEVKANKLSVNLSGASDMTVTGSSTDLKIDASGASSFKSWDFATDNCNVQASGASSVSFTVNKELNAHASGASSIHYKGEGVIKEIKTSGASNISKKS
jgi:hypothetical protein